MRSNHGFYERGTNLIFHLQHSDLDYETLSKQELGKYRELVLWIGTAAINERRPRKALNILKLLESFEDKTPRELFALGAAYFWESVGEEDEGIKRTYLKEIQSMIKAACEQDDTNPVAFWILRWVYDELGLCEKSIEANQKTLALDPRFAPWAYWTIAVSQLKQDKLDLALEALQFIPPGPWWLEMYKDEEMSRLKQDLRFGALYKERRFYDPQRYQLTL